MSVLSGRGALSGQHHGIGRASDRSETDPPIAIDSRQSLGAELHVPEVQKIELSLQHRVTVSVLVPGS